MQEESAGQADTSSSFEKIKKQLNSCGGGNFLLQGPLLKRSDIVSSLMINDDLLLERSIFCYLLTARQVTTQLDAWSSLHLHNSTNDLVGIYVTYVTTFLADSKMGMEMDYIGCINGKA